MPKRKQFSNEEEDSNNTPRRRKSSRGNNNPDGALSSPPIKNVTSNKKNNSEKKKGLGIKGFGWKEQDACIVCKHFRAKKQCIHNKCRRCCGKDGTTRCPYHHEEYEEERRIIELANNNRNNILLNNSKNKKNSGNQYMTKHAKLDIFQPIPRGMFHEKSFKNIGDTACIFNINTMFINEKNDWLENQERKYLRNLKFNNRKSR